LPASEVVPCTIKVDIFMLVVFLVLSCTLLFVQFLSGGALLPDSRHSGEHPR